MSTQFVAFVLLQYNVAVKFSLSQQSVLCCALCLRLVGERMTRDYESHQLTRVISCQAVTPSCNFSLQISAGGNTLNSQQCYFILIYFILFLTMIYIYCCTFLSIECLRKIYFIVIVNVRLSFCLSSIYHVLGLDTAERILLFQRFSLILAFNY